MQRPATTTTVGMLRTLLADNEDLPDDMLVHVCMFAPDNATIYRPVVDQFEHEGVLVFAIDYPV